MSIIRQIEINNFRTIKCLTWHPKPGLNCLIGPGDSGKSTILDAIDLALSSRRSYPFTDADFHQLDTDNPIVIMVTLGQLDDQLKSIDTYGLFLRGFDNETKEILDEPQNSKEVALTIKLIVEKDLEPEWFLFSSRAEAEGVERRLSWKHRELIAPIKLGASPIHHLAWGNRSVLNKLSENTLDISSTLAEISRSARSSFAENSLDELSGVLQQVQQIAGNLGVAVGDLKAQIDVNNLSLSQGAISLHNADNSPLRQLGTGSTRLLIAGLQKAASSSSILIVDEAELGLEPFRITRLLHELGAKAQAPEKQVFITTHSPYVVRELRAEQLHVIRQKHGVESQPSPQSHLIFSLNGDDAEQATVRACAEAFFARRVIVCEGKTEIGLIKGIDQYSQEQNSPSIQANGTFSTDGGGDGMFRRASVFRSLGYPTAILKDSDKYAEHQAFTQQATNQGIAIFEWHHGYATEDVIFNCCPIAVIPQLLNLAIERKSIDAVAAHILSYSKNQFTLDYCQQYCDDNIRPVLALAAKKKSWYKDIEPAEIIGKTMVGPNYNSFNAVFTGPLNQLFLWARAIQG